MGKIGVLDENMINMIAAGEVIERPGSVVKELVENSIDAGANKITVQIEDGGKKLISVTDDGAGMDGEDLAKAFESHATSKIRVCEDLGRISTMGFRGEALASIASVAQVYAVSKPANSIEANCVEIDCGKKGQVKPCSSDCGTTIEVREIFYKLPARRKFLRSSNTEISHISEQFSRIALCHNELDMTLVHNGKVIYSFRRHESVRERAAVVVSGQAAEGLMETQSSEKGLEIFALLGRPEVARANSKYQYVFLNGRFIRDKFISHAIREAYRGFIEPNKYPAVFLYLKMPLEAYDVNVHPTKIEVRFDNSNLVHSQVLGVLREKLLSVDLDVQAGLAGSAEKFVPTAAVQHAEAERKQRITEAMADFFKKQKFSQTNQGRFSFSGSISAGRSGVGKMAGAKSYARGYEKQEGEKKFLQLHDSYIIAQSDEGFIVVDQHALHERIIYEDLCKRISSGKLESQRLLIPESFQVSDIQMEELKQRAKLIESLGIEMEPFGPGTMAIHSFPSLLGKIKPAEFVRDMLDLFTDKSFEADSERLVHEILDMAACKAAIKAGQKLSEEEMEQLIADKETVERASRCPHGRPTTIKFSLADLEKQFKRT